MRGVGVGFGSRVLMIGRLKVVSRPALVFDEVGTLGDPARNLALCLRPTRPAPQITGRVTMNGCQAR